MKIIFLTREGYDLPGARIRCYNFAAELAKRGLSTEVLSCADHLGALDGEHESRMGAFKKIGLNVRLWKTLDKEKDSLLWVQRFHYHALAPFLLNLLQKRRFVFDLDDWEMREDPKYYFGFYPSSKAHFFVRSLARRSVFCVAASRFLQDFLTPWNRKVYYVPSGVDTNAFRPFPAKDDSRPLILAWIGTFHRPEYVANIRLGLRCFQTLRQRFENIYLDIVGDGIHRAEIGRMAEEAGDPHIRLLGWVDPRRMPEYLAQADIGLFPVAGDTKFNRAKSPTKLFEYMAMGKPTVSSAIGEAKHVIKDGENGFLGRNEEECTQKLGRLIENASLREKMGRKACQDTTDQYSLRILGERLEAALRENC